MDERKPLLNFSEQRDKIVPALKVLQDNLGEVKKNATNPHFKSKYADLGAVLDASWDALDKAKLTVWQPPSGSIENDDYYVIVETWLLHESGQYVWWDFKIPTTKDDPQGAGSAVTYARRYALQSFLGIAPEDDDGNKGSRPAWQPQRAGANGNGKTDPPQPATGNGNSRVDDEPKKIDVAKRSQFNTFISENGLTPDVVKEIIEQVQEHYGNDVTGYVADLHEGDEEKEARRRLKKKAQESAAA